MDKIYSSLEINIIISYFKNTVIEGFQKKIIQSYNKMF